MKQITQKLVKEYLKKSKNELHDKNWHDFMKSKKIKSIEYAINKIEQLQFDTPIYKNISEIVEIANQYYDEYFDHI